MTREYLRQLIEKYANGVASEEENRELMDWYHQTPVNDVVWPAANNDEQQKIYQRILARIQPSLDIQKKPVINLKWLRIAAIFIIVLSAGYLSYYLFAVRSTSWVSVVNPAGKIQLLYLPDSTKVWLNASSELRYVKKFSKQRQVQLSGEAFFEVTHDKMHPFQITTDKMQTTVIGTSFNIQAYKTENLQTVSLVSGSVQIENNSGVVAVLKPAMQFTLNQEKGISEITSIDTGMVAGWKKGQLEFKGDSFAFIASTLERWYNTRMIFADTSLRNCRYYMSFDNTVSLEKVLSAIKELTGAGYSISRNKDAVTFFGKGCSPK